MKKLLSVACASGVVLLTGCSGAPAPAPTVTVTVTETPAVVSPAAPPEGDAWQRFRDDPREAFIFASAYETIWGYPIGNGEAADGAVGLADVMCGLVESGTYTWDTVTEPIDDTENAEKYVLTAQVFCPEVE